MSAIHDGRQQGPGPDGFIPNALGNSWPKCDKCGVEFSEWRSATRWYKPDNYSAHPEGLTSARLRQF